MKYNLKRAYKKAVHSLHTKTSVRYGVSSLLAILVILSALLYSHGIMRAHTPVSLAPEQIGIGQGVAACASSGGAYCSSPGKITYPITWDVCGHATGDTTFEIFVGNSFNSKLAQISGQPCSGSANLVFNATPSNLYGVWIFGEQAYRYYGVDPDLGVYEQAFSFTAPQNNCQVPPNPPTNLNGYCDAGGIHTSWLPAANTSYGALRIDDLSNGWDNSCDPSTTPGDVCGNTNSPWNGGGTPGHNYHWWVHDINGAGPSALTNGWYFSCPATPVTQTAPLTPPTLSLTGTIQGYKLDEYGSNVGVPVTISSDGVSDGGNPYFLTNLTPGGHTVNSTQPAGYTVWYLLSPNGGGDGAWHPGASVWANVNANVGTDLWWQYKANTPIVLPPPTTPAGSCSADGTQGTISWTAPSGYNTFYTRVSDNGGSNWPTTIGTNDNYLGTTETFATTPNTAYSWWVHTKNTTDGSWSTAVGGSFTCTPTAVVNNAPMGFLDGASCSYLDGWAFDQDTPSQEINVHLYKDGKFGVGTYVGSSPTDLFRPDINQNPPFASYNLTGSHGFHIPTPIGFKDNLPHSVYMYAIDPAGAGPNPLLGQGSGTFILNCPPPSASPNLTVDEINPHTAIAGNSQNYTAIVWNIGGGSTGIGFKNLFQIATDVSNPNNPLGVQTVAVAAMGVLGAGAHDNAIASYTFPAVGTYYMRVCANKLDANTFDAVPESDYTDNCGTWAGITVSGGIPPSCVQASDCTGSSICTAGLCAVCPIGTTKVGNSCPPTVNSCVQATDCTGNSVCTAGSCIVCPVGTTKVGNSCPPTVNSCVQASDCTGGYVCSAGVCTPPTGGSSNLILNVPRVRRGESAQVTWSATGVTSCSITAFASTDQSNGVLDTVHAVSGTITTHSTVTDAINSPTTVTLTCTVPGSPPVQVSSQKIIRLIPASVEPR